MLESAGAQPVIQVFRAHHTEGFHVDRGRHDLSGVTDIELQPADRQCVGERRTRKVDVDAAIDVGSMGAVHLAPATAAVGAEPEIWLVEVPEKQKLAHLPSRRETDHVSHGLPTNFACGCPPFVFPTQCERLVALVVPRMPAGCVAVGWEGGQWCRHGAQG